MIRTSLRTNPDGTVFYDYALTDEERDAGYVVNFAPGPITGTFVVQGEEYDCTPVALPVKLEHKLELAWMIHKAHHARGNFVEVPLPGDGSLAAFVQDHDARASAPDTQPDD